TSYTLFAPNNAAFIDAGYHSLEAVATASSDELTHIVERHLISGKRYTSEFDTLQPANSLIGTPVYVDRHRPIVHTDNYINGISSSRGRANMEAGTSIIHTVNRFLPTPLAASTIDIVQNDANLTLFYAAIVKASEA